MASLRDQIEPIVYFVGVALLGLVYYPLKRAIDEPWVFISIAVSWLIILRIVGRLLKRHMEAAENPNESQPN